MEQSQAEPTPRRPIWMWAGAAAGLALAVSMFLNNRTPHTRAAASRPSSGTFLISGTVVLGDGASFTKVDGGGCTGAGAHADVVDGAPVLIVTPAGAASGTLSVPRTLDGDTCVFSFSVPEVPKGQNRYVVMVADQDPLQYAEDQLTGALVSLRLG